MTVAGEATSKVGSAVHKGAVLKDENSQLCAQFRKGLKGSGLLALSCSDCGLSGGWVAHSLDQDGNHAFKDNGNISTLRLASSLLT